MRSSSRSAFSFPDIRRILLQGARAARGSPPMGRSGGGMCDPEKGGAGGSAASPSVGSKSHGESKHGSSNSNLHHGTPRNHHHVTVSERVVYRLAQKLIEIIHVHLNVKAFLIIDLYGDSIGN